MTAPRTVEKLLRTAQSHDPHVRAAVMLLHDHGKWLRNAEFAKHCVSVDGESAWVDWSAARECLDRGYFLWASSSELTVLDVAVELGRKGFRFSSLDGRNQRLLLEAFAGALGLPGGGPR